MSKSARIQELYEKLQAARDEIEHMKQESVNRMPSSTADGVNAVLAAWVKKGTLLGILWDYHRALDTHQHAGIAASVLVHELETVLETPWERGATMNTPRPLHGSGVTIMR